ncbi:DUF2442 domain-containing protein [Candidatus Electronema sp. TJ]|uniref:DUF2442 domain-containing protein n=1 Tax=Candidatus Electronema sp. TJ TaxID=3401573 RepID=UPI003AA8ABDC
MDKVIKAVPLADYTIDILTSSGVAGVFDVKPYLQGRAFQELRDEAYFRQVRPAHHGIAWPHEQDFSADTIIHDIRQAQGRAGGMMEGALQEC